MRYTLTKVRGIIARYFKGYAEQQYYFNYDYRLPDSTSTRKMLEAYLSTIQGAKSGRYILKSDNHKIWSGHLSVQQNNL